LSENVFAETSELLGSEALDDSRMVLALRRYPRVDGTESLTPGMIQCRPLQGTPSCPVNLSRQLCPVTQKTSVTQNPDGIYDRGHIDLATTSIRTCCPL
jgi:hypothetical protein